MQERLRNLLNEWEECETKFKNAPSRIRNAEKRSIARAVVTVLAEVKDVEFSEEDQKAIDEMKVFLASTV